MSKGLQGLMTVSTAMMEKYVIAVVWVMDEDRVVELFARESTEIQRE